MLKAYYELNPSVLDTRQFSVEIYEPCWTNELTIDESVLKTIPAVTMTQYVTYDALQLTWDDSIVFSNATPADASLCGTLVH